MRGSVFYLAPLLTRAGWAELPLPGGCRLGPRPIDIHLAGLTAMGAQVCAAAECVVLRRHGVCVVRILLCACPAWEQP